MLDSNGRTPRGLMKGNNIDMGFYDECLDVSQKFEEDDELIGRYCFGGLAIPVKIMSILNNQAVSAVLSPTEEVKSHIIRFIMGNC